MFTYAIAAVAAPTPADAEAALAAGDVAGAAKVWRKLVKAAPDNGAYWFALASVEHRLARWDDAAVAWGKAGALGTRPAISAYNEACARARAGDADGAFAALDVAAGLGAVNPEQLRADPDLASILADPRLEPLLVRADAALHPCDHDERYRAFDFWVGDWDVTSGGQPIGRNTITREQHGCVLVERWTDAFGNTGTSFSFLDPGTAEWRQLWVDGGGRIAEYAGAFDAPGHLVMEARTASPGPTESRSRGTWTLQADGTVRQVFESPGADGAWVVTFDGTYHRKP